MSQLIGVLSVNAGAVFQFIRLRICKFITAVINHTRPSAQKRLDKT